MAFLFVIGRIRAWNFDAQQLNFAAEVVSIFKQKQVVNFNQIKTDQKS
jgi:hypothetical protein